MCLGVEISLRAGKPQRIGHKSPLFGVAVYTITGSSIRPVVHDPEAQVLYSALTEPDAFLCTEDTAYNRGIALQHSALDARYVKSSGFRIEDI